MAYFFVYNLNGGLPIADESQAQRAAVLLGKSGVSLTDTFLRDELETERFRKASKKEKLEIMIAEFRRVGNTEVVEALERYKLIKMFNSFFARQHGFKKHTGTDTEWSEKEYLEFLANRMTDVRKYGMQALHDQLAPMQEFLVFYVNAADGEDKHDLYNSISVSLMEASYEGISCYHIMPESFMATVEKNEINVAPVFLFPDLIPLSPAELTLARKQTVHQRNTYHEALRLEKDVLVASEVLNAALRSCGALRNYYSIPQQLFYQFSLGWAAPALFWDFFYEQGMIPDKSWAVIQVKRSLHPENWIKPVPFLLMKATGVIC